MREIKFRAWNDDDKKMFEPQIANSEDGINNYFIDKYNVFMQYTGLKDKNGVEIYEGDIVKKDNDTVAVQYSEYHSSFQVYYFLNMMSKTSLYEFGYSHELEVIGNIYENKELLGDNN